MSSPPPSYDVVFFDGTCGLCHWFVRLLLRLDPLGQRYRYAHGASGAESVVVVTASGETLIRSDAVLYALKKAGGAWSVLSVFCRFVPLPIRDWVYDWVARNRRRWVKACPLMPPEFRERFLG